MTPEERREALLAERPDAEAVIADYERRLAEKDAEIERLRKVLEAIPDPQAVAMMGAEIERLRGGRFVSYETARDMAEDVRADERRRTAEEIVHALTAVSPVEWALAGQHAGIDAARIAREVGGSE